MKNRIKVSFFAFFLLMTSFLGGNDVMKKTENAISSPWGDVCAEKKFLDLRLLEGQLGAKCRKTPF